MVIGSLGVTVDTLFIVNCYIFIITNFYSLSMRRDAKFMTE